LIKALKDKTIAGAVLDVFREEPLPESSELWDMPNLLMTPHCADWTDDYFYSTMGIFVENLERYAKGENLKNTCNKKLGY
jgi:phosphoglycerate dehydrogenase-like enzyme